MNSLWYKAFLFCILIALIGCTGKAGKGIPQWGQFHGGLSSQGYQQIDSGFALSSAWISQPYKISSSSPVIGKNHEGKEVIYVGTTDSFLVAIGGKDGSEKWKRSFGRGDAITRIVSTAAVSEKGDIFVITNRQKVEFRAQSMLHRVDTFGNVGWSYAFPDNGYTTGSPKVLTSGEDTLIFVYVSVGYPGNIQGELFVLRDDQNHAELLDRKALGECRYEATSSDPDLDNVFSYMDDVWDLISGFPIEFKEGGISLPDRFVDPTVAVLADREKPLITIADNLCSIGAYEWNGIELSVLWREEHHFKKHSSAALLPNGLMVFGRQNGKVLAYDVETGVKMWEYDAGQPVFATPAGSSGQFIFVVSKTHVHGINAADGTLVHDESSPRLLALAEQTHASPAVTANRVYVSTEEMVTATYDLKTRAHDKNFHGNGLSSVAVGNDGAVYAVSVDGRVRKYRGRE